MFRKLKIIIYLRVKLKPINANIQKGYLPLYKRTEHREYFKNLSIIDVLEKFKRTPYLITFEKQYNWCFSASHFENLFRKCGYKNRKQCWCVGRDYFMYVIGGYR